MITEFMPGRKRRSRRSGRKGRTKRRRITRSRKRLTITGFPKLKVAKLRYVDEIALTSPAVTGLSAAWGFRANGCYDPNAAVGGHQPKGFDQWMALYSHFNVLGSKCTVRLAGTGSDTFAWGVARTAANGEMNGKTLPYILECRMNKGYALSGGFYGRGQNDVQRSRSAKYSQKKQFGPNSTNKENLTGAFNADPLEQIYYEVWIAPSTGSVVVPPPASVSSKFIVTIDYIVMFTEQKVLPQS